MLERHQRPRPVVIEFLVITVMQAQDIAGTAHGRLIAFLCVPLSASCNGLHPPNQAFHRPVQPISRDQRPHHGLGCKTVMWTLIPGDWLDRPVECLIRRMQPIATRAQRNTKKGNQAAVSGTGDILCLHDGYHKELNYDRTRTLVALEHWLPRWRDLGLEFVTMDEAALIL